MDHGDDVDTRGFEEVADMTSLQTLLLKVLKNAAQRLGSVLILGLPIVLRTLPGKLGIPVNSATVEQLQFMIVGALIIFFLIVEPNGLARLWQIGKQKLRVWPFPY